MNLNGYPEICDNCGQRRTCNDAGYCHECEQSERDANPTWDEIADPEQGFTLTPVLAIVTVFTVSLVLIAQSGLLHAVLARLAEVR